MAIVKLGVAKSIIKGSVITLILTVPLTIAEFFLREPKNVYAIFGTFATDLIKIGIPTLIMGIAGIGLTGSTIFASFPMGVVIIISIVTGAILATIDERYRLTEKLIEALESLPIQRDKVLTGAGDGFHGFLRRNGLGMGNWF